MRTSTKALLGFAVGWLVCMVEYALTASAAGGPFTILLLPLVAAFLSAVYVGAAALAGLLLRLPGVRTTWRDTGCVVLLLAVPPGLVLIFSSPLGLRSIDPASHYSVMSPWLSVPCYVLIVFPFVNLPTNAKANPALSLTPP